MHTIQQKPDTRIAPSGKNFIFSMWDTNTDNWGNAEGGVPSYSYVDELNENADLGGKLGPAPKPFSGEGTGQQIQVDYPWAIGDTTTIIILYSATITFFVVRNSPISIINSFTTAIISEQHRHVVWKTGS